MAPIWHRVVSDTDDPRITVRIPSELVKKMDYARKQNGMISRTVVMRLALSRFLNNDALFAPVQRNMGNGWEPVPFDEKESCTGGETKRALDDPEARAAKKFREATRGDESG